MASVFQGPDQLLAQRETANAPQRAMRGLFGREFGALLVLVEQMHKRLDQSVIDLANTMIGKAQQIEARGLSC